ncbi:LLM class F420-dependent oxidoreductase [Dermatobacter hominis]|uniref:LLM class F420-dependent oxidoreductase n=1 Tax=Dermatobacter hominis TaxID=2884263 RepID=UPI001D1276C3|nr:LLM class F420-dependent oxidoreductase [Dermatobacter hominis]UDY35192.1 LLM class F420-dependent oxidoreductase [Dermatobacter hominis]
MTRLSYQIPNFTYPDTAPADLFGTVVAQAKEAEDAGFDRVMVMDHFYQLPGIGEPDEPMLECYTTLAALAQHTSRVRLSALVTGNTYRNPALLAKTITTLDHVSGGRATLGIGAGWFELEHDALGFEFGTFSDRFEKLDEALQIIVPMLRGERPTVSGEHYRVADAVNSPAPVSRIPLMIGGNGERKTLRMVAQYADESNLMGMRGDLDVPHKLEVLAEHCERFGRDPSEIDVTVLVGCVVAPTTAEVDADLRAMAEAKGWGDGVIDMVKQMLIVGDADTVGEQLAEIAASGVDGLTCNLPANGHVPGRVALLGEVADRALAGAGR